MYVSALSQARWQLLNAVVRLIVVFCFLRRDACQIPLSPQAVWLLPAARRGRNAVLRAIRPYRNPPIHTKETTIGLLAPGGNKISTPLKRAQLAQIFKEVARKQGPSSGNRSPRIDFPPSAPQAMGGLSPTTSASSFFSADSEFTVVAAPESTTMSDDGMDGEDDLQGTQQQQEQHHFTQGSDDCEATQPVWSQTQEATQPTSSASRSKPKPLSETCWAILVPAAPNIGLQVWELRRDYTTPYRIGRNAARSEFHLPARKISSLHARIWMQPLQSSGPATSAHLTSVPDEGSVVIEDCSSNGVYVEGVKIGKNQKTVLVSGNEISFGPPSTAIDEDYRQRFFFHSRSLLTKPWPRIPLTHAVFQKQVTSSAPPRATKPRWTLQQPAGSTACTT